MTERDGIDIVCICTFKLNANEYVIELLITKEEFLSGEYVKQLCNRILEKLSTVLTDFLLKELDSLQQRKQNHEEEIPDDRSTNHKDLY